MNLREIMTATRLPEAQARQLQAIIRHGALTVTNVTEPRIRQALAALVTKEWATVETVGTFDGRRMTYAAIPAKVEQIRQTIAGRL